LELIRPETTRQIKRRPLAGIQAVPDSSAASFAPIVRHVTMQPERLIGTYSDQHRKFVRIANLTQPLRYTAPNFAD
jgi:hypothetical protein